MGLHILLDKRSRCQDANCKLLAGDEFVSLLARATLHNSIKTYSIFYPKIGKGRHSCGQERYQLLKISYILLMCCMSTHPRAQTASATVLTKFVMSPNTPPQRRGSLHDHILHASCFILIPNNTYHKPYRGARDVHVFLATN